MSLEKIMAAVDELSPKLDTKKQTKLAKTMHEHSIDAGLGDHVLAGRVIDTLTPALAPEAQVHIAKALRAHSILKSSPGYGPHFTKLLAKLTPDLDTAAQRHLSKAILDSIVVYDKKRTNVEPHLDKVVKQINPNLCYDAQLDLSNVIALHGRRRVLAEHIPAISAKITNKNVGAQVGLAMALSAHAAEYGLGKHSGAVLKALQPGLSDEAEKHLVKALEHHAKRGRLSEPEKTAIRKASVDKRLKQSTRSALEKAL